MAERLEETLRRLKQERDEADRRYNDALTALDKSFSPPTALPAAPPPYDEHQITPLNEAWNILLSPPAATGIAGRLTGFIWRTVGPYLQRQLTFNSRLVDHLNRNASAHRDAHRSLHDALALLNARGAAEAEFHSRLLMLLQQITPYVDTKDRDSAAAALVLNASLSAMADRLAKHSESMAVRESRYEARTGALAAEHEDLRAMVGVAQQAALTTKRELERLHERSDGSKPVEPRISQVHEEPDELHSMLNAYKYVGFENQFRGSREVIRQRLETYLPYFDGASDVLDVGCGRGEFLDLLAARGITARGLDLNHEMVEECRARGLQAVEGDAVTVLESIADGSLGGVFAAQVVEHLEPSYLLRFLELAFHKLKPGGHIVLETLNPACWVAFFESYIRDITHRWPLHPETLKYLVIASGFASASIEWRSPVPQQDRLQPVRVPADADVLTSDLAEIFNANVEKLNARLFTHMDYAIVGRKGQRAVDE
jgi:2-polyprenyl-3-methyl-5-hydroxy-6-metoxy-1,4-benzoquinol methylase